jgi:hypothetical protein
MPRYDEKGWPLDVWGNRLKPGNTRIYEPSVRDISRPCPASPYPSKIQLDWCERQQPLSTALALGVLATRIRARHGSFEEARAAWALEGADPQAAALAEMRQLMGSDRPLMCLLRTHLRWPPLR